MLSNRRRPESSDPPLRDQTTSRHRCRRVGTTQHAAGSRSHSETLLKTPGSSLTWVFNSPSAAGSRDRSHLMSQSVPGYAGCGFPRRLVSENDAMKQVGLVQKSELGVPVQLIRVGSWPAGRRPHNDALPFTIVRESSTRPRRLPREPASSPRRTCRRRCGPRRGRARQRPGPGPDRPRRTS